MFHFGISAATLNTRVLFSLLCWKSYLFILLIVWLKNKLIISIWYYNIDITYYRRCKKWVSFLKRLSFHLHRKPHHFHVKTLFPNPFLTAFTIISILLWLTQDGSLLIIKLSLSNLVTVRWQLYFWVIEQDLQLRVSPDQN